MLSSLESQNDAEVEGISSKVKMLKDVSNISDLRFASLRLNSKREREKGEPFVFNITANRNSQLTIAIGDEIRDTAHMTDLENSFEGTRVRLRGNMKRMLRMAEKTGVGWRVWLGFICAVFLLFFYVWIF